MDSMLDGLAQALDRSTCRSEVATHCVNFIAGKVLKCLWQGYMVVAFNKKQVVSRKYVGAQGRWGIVLSQALGQCRQFFLLLWSQPEIGLFLVQAGFERRKIPIRWLKPVYLVGERNT